MNSILLICESEGDVKNLIKIANTLPDPLKDIDILSTLPEIRSILENNGISSMTSADYISRKDYEIINSDCIKLYSELEVNVKKDCSNSFSKCFVNMFLYYTFFAIYTIIWNARLLQNILDQGKYSKYITYLPQRNIDTSPWFISEQNILHLLLCQILDDKSIDHEILKRTEGGKMEYFGNSLLFTVRRILQPIYSLVLRRISRIEKNTYKVMVPTTAKNMNLLCADMVEKYPSILFFCFGEGKSVLSELNKIFILLKYVFTKKGIHDQNLHKGQIVKLSLSLLTPLGVKDKQSFASDSFNKLILSMQEPELNLKILNAKELTLFIQLNKILHILSYLKYQQSLSFGLKRFFELCKPDLIFSQMSLGLTCTLGYLSKTLEIPSMLISHGTHVLHLDGAADLEHKLIAKNMLLGGYRYLGLQTSLSYDYAVKNQIPNHSIVKINPTMLYKNQSKKKIKSSKLIVLHAGTIKSGIRRFLYETPDELLETFQETVKIISTCFNIELIIKFRAIEEFSFKSLKTLLGPLPENVSLVSDGPIGDFLASSHLLMSFSSTTIEEALINDIPVLLYGGKGRYSHIPTEPFKLVDTDDILSPVTFVDSKESLAQYFKALDKNHAKFIDHQFDFSRFRLKDSMRVIDWLGQNSILKKHENIDCYSS